MTPPDEAQDRTATADALIAGYLDDYRLGKAPPLQAFIAAHPDFRETLENDLPLVLAIERLPESAAAEAAQRNVLLHLPTVIDGEFRLERLIGTGGMGSVYAATQLSLNRPCAIKILSGSLNARPEERERFGRESKLIARLRHPNIIAVLSAGTFEGLSYYAMDLVEGPPPTAFCGTPEAVARLGLQLANALAYAHGFGIVHCDVKPSNLLTEPDGTVRLGDFGLSQSLNDTHGNSGGTLRYMPPERLRKEPFTGAADQYALGITLRELLGDTCLKALPPAALKKRILAGRLPPLPGVPHDLSAILGKLTAADPNRRYTSMHRAAEDLANYLEHRPVAACPVSLTRHLMLWARRRPAVAAASALALFCACSAVAALAIGYKNTSEARQRAEQAHRHAEQARQRAEHHADVANKTLARVLSHAGAALPSKAGARFLSSLLPYYDDLAKNRTLRESTLCTAYAAIGTAALRSGQPELALGIFERLKTLEDSSVTDNLYASGLYLCGRTEEAREADRDNVRRNARAADAPRRLQALIALQRLVPVDPSYRSQLTELLNDLRRDIPDSSEFRLQVAQALLFAPETVSRDCRPYPERSDICNARLILTDLARKNLSARFDSALVLLAGKYLQKLPPGQQADGPFVTAALTASGRILGRWLGDSGVSHAVIGFWLAYARYLRKNGNTTHYTAFTDRLYGILDVLFYNEETNSDAREFLLRLLLNRLETACSAKDAAGIHLRYIQLQEKLRFIGPDRADDIRRRADELLREHPYTFGSIGTHLQPQIDHELDCSLFVPTPTVPPAAPPAPAGKPVRRQSMWFPLIPAQRTGTPKAALRVFGEDAKAPKAQQ